MFRDPPNFWLPLHSKIYSVTSSYLKEATLATISPITRLHTCGNIILFPPEVYIVLLVRLLNYINFFIFFLNIIQIGPK